MNVLRPEFPLFPPKRNYIPFSPENRGNKKDLIYLFLGVMKKFVFGNRLAALVLLLLLSLLVFVTCVDREDKNIQEKKDTIAHSPEETVVARKQTFEEFAGSRSCKNCHARVSASHAHTAHFKTSGPASEKNIRGSFKKK